MATLSTARPTLLDLAKRLDPNDRIAVIAELLAETNEILDDAVWMEGNLPTGHRSTIRTGLPTPTWRKLYGGVQPTKSTTAQVTDGCGMLEAIAEVDKALADLNGNTAAFRLSEERAHIEAMSQELADTLFYGNQGTEPEAFTGLSPRYNSLSASNSENIVVGGGSGTDNGSIWLLGWSEDKVTMIYPKGSKIGLQHKDMGETLIQDADGSNGRMLAYVSHFRWDAGVHVKDWRYAVRIPNIDKSALTKDAASGADLADLMFQAMRRIPNLAGCKPAFYMSRDMATFLGRQQTNLVKNSSLTIDNVGGRMVETFKGIPVRRVDALSADEALVS